MNNAPLPTFDENVANKEKAVIALEKVKVYEKKTKLFRLQVNKNTIVCCKNEERLEDYKKHLR